VQIVKKVPGCGSTHTLHQDDLGGWRMPRSFVSIFLIAICLFSWLTRSLDQIIKFPKLSKDATCLAAASGSLVGFELDHIFINMVSDWMGVQLITGKLVLAEITLAKLFNRSSTVTNTRLLITASNVRRIWSASSGFSLNRTHSEHHFHA